MGVFDKAFYEPRKRLEGEVVLRDPEFSNRVTDCVGWVFRVGEKSHKEKGRSKTV